MVYSFISEINSAEQLLFRLLRFLIGLKDKIRINAGSSLYSFYLETASSTRSYHFPYPLHIKSTFMAEYQTPKDRAYTETLINSAPKEAAAFLNLKYTAERKDGVIPVKYRELMSVAVALTTQCAYCIESHINNAVQAGATREEIAETVFIAAAIRAGGAVGNGLMAMRLFEEASTTNR